MELTEISDDVLLQAIARNGIQLVVTEEGVLISYTNEAGLTELDIPNSVKSIGPSAFLNFTLLTSVIIPSSVTSIDASAFENCSSLSSVIIPSSVTSIGAYTFKGCSLLTNITLDRVNSQGLTTLATGCFLNTGITVQTILKIYRMGYTRYNLITSGISTNIVDRVISDEDGFVNITVYYYFTIEN